MKDIGENTVLSSGQLKKMPYKVPEGYFRHFKDDIMDTIAESGHAHSGITGKLAPYLSIAAMFAIIATAGTFFLRSTAEENEYTFEDYLVMSDCLTGMLTYQLEGSQYPDTQPDEQDIADYLIHTGVGTQSIELSYK